MRREDILNRTVSIISDGNSVHFSSEQLDRILSAALIEAPSLRLFRVRLRGRTVTARRLDLRKALAAASALLAALATQSPLAGALAVIVMLAEAVGIQHTLGPLHAAVILCLYSQSRLTASHLIDCVTSYTPASSVDTITAAIADLEALGAVTSKDEWHTLAEAVSVRIEWPSIA